MKKRILAFILLLTTLLCLCSCSKTNDNSTFSIQFIDVGQGDSALVECDGHYMLIDGGDTNAGQKVYDVLEEKGIQKLDILAVSHLHADHYGGLTKALTYASSIGVTISNSTYSDKETFRKFEHELGINGSKITIPVPGDKYDLGSATVEVVDVSAEEDNDSLVLLITYGDTRFLFTGDIEDDAQARISEKYQNDKDEPYKIDLIKMPHAACRALLFDICRKHGLQLEEEPEYGGRKYLEKQDFILAKQKEQLAAQSQTIQEQEAVIQEKEEKLDELTLKLDDVETLIDNVSEIAYDKAVEVVTDTVRVETHKQDIRLVEQSKEWVLSPERKASKKEKEYAAARLDNVVSKITKAMQTALSAMKSVLTKPEVRKENTQQIKEKARTSIYEMLNRNKAIVAAEDAARKKIKKQNMER